MYKLTGPHAVSWSYEHNTEKLDSTTSSPWTTTEITTTPAATSMRTEYTSLEVMTFLGTLALFLSPFASFMLILFVIRNEKRKRYSPLQGPHTV